MRRALAAFVVALALPAPAQAATHALARLPRNAHAAIALAGDQALYSTVHGRTVQVDAVPLTGGPPRTVFTYTAQHDAKPEVSLTASATRAAVVVAERLDRDGSVPYFFQAFSGPAAGPWTALGPRSRIFRDNNPIAAQVDGDRLFVTEWRGELENVGVTAYTPDPFDVPFYSPVDAATAHFAGDLVAYTTAVPGEEDDSEEPHYGGRRLILRDWRTGQNLATADFPGFFDPTAVAADGRVTGIVRDDRVPSGTYLYTPGGTPRRIGPQGVPPIFAGDAVAYVNWTDGVRVVERNGRTRPVGPPTASGGVLAADARHILWNAHDCLLVAGLTDGPASDPGAGPCPRSELKFIPLRSQKLDHRVTTAYRCVAAPKRCAGTVTVKGSTTPQRYAIAPGTRGDIPLVVPDKTLRTAKRTGYVEYTLRTSDGQRAHDSVSVAPG